MKKKGKGLPGYMKKQALSTLKNGMTFKLELKLMKSLHKDYNQRKERCTLKLKKQGSHTLKQLKSYSFDEIKNLFEITMRRVHTFVPMESENEREIPELAAGIPAEEPKDKKEEELSQERIQQMMIIVPEQGMNVEALQTKYPIIDWEIYTEGARKEDLVKLWSLKLQKHIHDNLTWKLYDSCGVHHVSIDDGINIYMLVEKEYLLSRGTLTMMLVAKLFVEQDSEMSKELLRKIFMQVERPRR
ncbi:hypothetical protein Tco_1244356 [Tanacetum coccineum]